jgi:hypothetical protein
MTDAEHIEIITFALVGLPILDELKALKAQNKPIPYGIGQKYKHAVIARDKAQGIYEQKATAYWYGYAACMEEANDILDNLEIMPFVDKKSKH